MNIALSIYQHTNVKLCNIKANNSYIAKHIKNEALSIIYIFTILKINLLKESVIKYCDYDNK